VIGAILATVVSQLLAMARGVNAADAINDLIGQGRMPPEMTGALEQVRDMPAAVFIIGSLLVTLFIYPIFSMLGACSALRSSSANRPRRRARSRFCPRSDTRFPVARSSTGNWQLFTAHPTARTPWIRKPDLEKVCRCLAHHRSPRSPHIASPGGRDRGAADGSPTRPGTY
jgi:hypothetical protein